MRPLIKEITSVRRSVESVQDAKELGFAPDGIIKVAQCKHSCIVNVPLQAQSTIVAFSPQPFSKDLLTVSQLEYSTREQINTAAGKDIARIVIGSDKGNLESWKMPTRDNTIKVDAEKAGIRITDVDFSRVNKLRIETAKSGELSKHAVVVTFNREQDLVIKVKDSNKTIVLERA